MFQARPFSVTVHPLTSTADIQACAYERGDQRSCSALVLIGGLSSGPHTALGLVDAILQSLNGTKLGYSVWEIRIRSSYSGFGYSSLAHDVEDIAVLVKYLRELGKKSIVLMGSSTGCQDCMGYMNVGKYNAPEVDAYIMQAPTSDRETAGLLMPPEFYQKTLEFAEREILRGNKDGMMPKELMPMIFSSPISVYRWHSLIAKGGDDDCFSSDIDEATLGITFGRINKPTMISPSENDEMVPVTVNKQKLLQKWIMASPVNTVSQLSCLVPGADHKLSAMESRNWFANRVVQFLESL